MSHSISEYLTHTHSGFCLVLFSWLVLFGSWRALLQSRCCRQFHSKRYYFSFAPMHARFSFAVSAVITRYLVLSTCMLIFFFAVSAAATNSSVCPAGSFSDVGFTSCVPC